MCRNIRPLYNFAPSAAKAKARFARRYTAQESAI